MLFHVNIEPTFQNHHDEDRAVKRLYIDLETIGLDQKLALNIWIEKLTSGNKGLLMLNGTSFFK